MNYLLCTYNVIHPMDVFDIRNLFIAYIPIPRYMYIYLIFESGRHHPIRTLKLNFKIHSYAKMPTNETK